jgi:maltooligosyltrehalose trehalohydrolase
VPDPQDVETMRRSVLEWDELARAPHDEILRWHRELIAMRRAHPVLRSGAFPAVSVDGSVLVVDYGPLVVVANFSTAEASCAVDGERVLLASSFATVDGGAVRLAPTSVAIVARDASAG